MRSADSYHPHNGERARNKQMEEKVEKAGNTGGQKEEAGKTKGERRIKRIKWRRSEIKGKSLKSSRLMKVRRRCN